MQKDLPVPSRYWVFCESLGKSVGLRVCGRWLSKKINGTVN